MVSNQRLIIESCLVFIVSAILVIISGYAAGVAPFLPSSYSRWDSDHYLSIASSGYELFSCARLPGYDPAAWCGNSGWLPGYPILIRIVETFQISGETAGFLISNFFYFGCIALLRQLLECISPGRRNNVCLLMAAVFPGAVYYHAIFPISMLMFFALSSLILVTRGYNLWASLSAACGALTYSTGFLLSAVVGVGVLFGNGGPWRRRIASAMVYSAISFSGFIAVLLLHQIMVGHWNAFFLTQAKYGHGLYNPLRTVAHSWSDLKNALGNQQLFAKALLSLLMDAVVIGFLSSFLMRIRKATQIEWVLATQIALFFAFPLIIGHNVSPTRAGANLLPLVAMAARLGSEMQVLILIAFAFLGFELNIAFFESVLI